MYEKEENMDIGLNCIDFFYDFSNVGNVWDWLEYNDVKWMIWFLLCLLNGENKNIYVGIWHEIILMLYDDN